jgi:hypothetical protein
MKINRKIVAWFLLVLIFSGAETMLFWIGGPLGLLGGFLPVVAGCLVWCLAVISTD